MFDSSFVQKEYVQIFHIIKKKSITTMASNTLIKPKKKRKGSYFFDQWNILDYGKKKWTFDAP